MARQKKKAAKSQRRSQGNSSAYSAARKVKRQQYLATRRVRRSIKALELQHQHDDDDYTDEQKSSTCHESVASHKGTEPSVSPEDATSRIEDNSREPSPGCSEVAGGHAESPYKADGGCARTDEIAGGGLHRIHKPPIAFLTLQMHSAASKHHFHEIVQGSEQGKILRTSARLRPNQLLHGTHANIGSLPATAQAMNNLINNVVNKLLECQREFIAQAEAIQGGSSHHSDVVEDVIEHKPINDDHDSDNNNEDKDEDDNDGVLVRGVRYLTEAQWQAVDHVIAGIPAAQKKKINTIMPAVHPGVVSIAETSPFRTHQPETDAVGPKTRSRLRKQGLTLTYSSKMTSGLNVVRESR